jgi:phenylalanyl-tRNA synthetase beta chain
VIVAADVPAASVEASIRRNAGPLLRDATLFDIYRGRPLTGSEKSLAYRLAFQADDRTLVESEVDAAVSGVTDGLAADVGGRLRA